MSGPRSRARSCFCICWLPSCLVLALLALPAPAAEPAREASLLSAHLEQAKALEPSPAQTGTDATLAKLKAEIAAKRSAWEQQDQLPPQADELLKGLPGPVLEQALAAAPEDTRTAEILKAGVTPALLMVLVDLRSPELRAAREKWRATLKRFDQAAYLEDLLAQYRAFVRELDVPTGPRMSMSGELLRFPSALALKGELVDAEARLAWLEYQLMRREQINAAARAFFQVQSLGRATEALRATREVLAQTVESATARLGTSLVNQADVLMAQSESAMLEAQLANLESERLNAVAEANAMLALPPRTFWGPLTAPDLAPPSGAPGELLKTARTESQELAVARQEVTTMELMLRMAETEVLVRAPPGYAAFAPSSGADAGPTRSPMAIFPEETPPMAGAPGFGPNAAYLDELRVRVTQARRELAAAEARADFRVQDALYRVEAARRDCRTLREASVPKLAEAAETIRKRFAANEVALPALLEARRVWLEARLKLEQARGECNAAAVALQDALGRSAAGLAPETAP
jgi:hypothetical protein